MWWFVFVFGLIVGSFLNVVIFRWRTGEGVNGRSRCSQCGVKLKACELVPILSYLWQRGRCNNCGSKISIQYPLVELSSGLLLAGIASQVVATPFKVVSAIILLIMLVVLVYDIRHKIIPDEMVILASFLTLIVLFVPALSPWGGDLKLVFPGMQAVMSGIIVALPFFLIFLVSRGRWIGFGDVKLMLPVGWFLGYASGFMVIILSSWLGLIYIGAVYLVSRIRKRESAIIKNREIPYGPFLVAAFYIQVFWAISFNDLALWFSFFST